MTLLGKTIEKLAERSAFLGVAHRSRSNSWISLAWMLGAFPVALVLLPFLSFLRFRGSPFRMMTLHTETAFTYLVLYLESIRGQYPTFKSYDLIAVLDKWSHETLCKLYAEELSTRIIPRNGARGLVIQALMLQPRFLVQVEHSDWSYTQRPFQQADAPLKVTSELQGLRAETLRRAACFRDEYVALAVYTIDYDIQRAPYPGYWLVTENMESNGLSLVDGIKYLHASGRDVLLLGSPDTGKAQVPLDLPRLADFGELGGAHEVALAAGCKYFWTDHVGAAYLAWPFKRPILSTNTYSLRNRKHMMTGWWILPTRFQSPSGREVTFREHLLSKPPPSKQRELRWILNSPEEIVAAHSEMLARLNGTFRESAVGATLQLRLRALMNEFPEFGCNIPSSFLVSHPYLLE